MFCVISVVNPAQSVTRYVLTTVTIAPSQVAVVISSLIKVTTGVPSQLSATFDTKLISAAGMSLKHSTSISDNASAVGGVTSSATLKVEVQLAGPQSSVTIYS